MNINKDMLKEHSENRTSDKRLMCDVYGIDRKQAYERALKITGIFYKNKNHLGNRKLGFVAQEVAKQFPEVVIKDTDGIYHMNIEELLPVLFQALKYQNDVISKLQEEVNAPLWKRLFKRK